MTEQDNKKDDSKKMSLWKKVGVVALSLIVAFIIYQAFIFLTAYYFDSMMGAW